MHIRVQHGVALLMLLLFIVVGGGVLFVKATSHKSINSVRQEKTQKALIAAREALVAYAVSAENRPGELPCPDVNNDGKLKSEDGVGPNCASLRGWLPWFRLGLGDIRDGHGERLWYAIADPFRPYGSNPPVGLTLNSDTQTDIVIDGVNPTTPRVAAIIISPGEILAINEKNRTLESDNNADDLVSSYLEEDNHDSDKTTYTSWATTDFNDILSVITVDQIMERVESRVKNTVVTQIEDYYSNNGFYPYAEPIPGQACDGGSTANEGYLQLESSAGCQYTNVLTFPAWFQQNDWHRMFWYAVAPACEYGTTACSGGETTKITVGTNVDIESLILFSKEKLNAVNNSCGSDYAQARPSDVPCDYIDSHENYDMNGIFENPTSSATSNDELVIIN